MLALATLIFALPLAQAGASTGAHAGSDLQHGSDPQALHGKQLVAQYQCLSCHRADPVVEQHVWSEQAPTLHDIGERVAPVWLMGRLTDARLSGGHGRMPDVLGSASIEQRIEISAQLMHFLYQQQNFEFQPLEIGSGTVEQGKELFDTLGCLPCHDDRLRGKGLAQKYSVASLRDLLMDPLKARPYGTMPDSRLSKSEATAISAWLLRDQFKYAKVDQVPGLKYRYYEHNKWPSSGEFDWDSLEPVEQGVAIKINHDYGSRRENYGLLFDGYLEVPEAGEYRFATRSDDGSNLWIGGKWVVDNSGIHAPARKVSEPVKLTAGRHPIRISFYEAGGGEELQVHWSGPGFDWRPFGEGELFHRGIAPAPLRHEDWLVKKTEAERGREWFGQLGCANCHTGMGVEPPAMATVWEELDAANPGCLQPDADPHRKVDPTEPLSGFGVPRYDFKKGEREALLAFLGTRTSLKKEPSVNQIMQRGMERFGCLNCHTTKDWNRANDIAIGGPPTGLHPFFTSTDDLGDEGRFPPDLSSAGEKFKPDWLSSSLASGIQIRPAMITRMPAFGDAVKPLAAAMSAAGMADNSADAAAFDPDAVAATFDPLAAKAGHELVGVGGLSCIICHGAGGYPSIGVQGPDLLDMYQRLRPEWYRKWMEAPPTMRPGTRMPMFWFNGKSAVTHVLDGDMDAQIEAIWQYLALENVAPLPKGLVVDQSEYDLIPVERPIYFGTFMKGLSARVMTVGFPQRVSMAFDQHNVRAALAWQGDYINAKGTWQGRAGQLEQPAGNNVLNLPAGMAVAVLRDAVQPWPSEPGKEAGWRYRGHSRDSEENPTFRYQYGDLQVAETWIPTVSPGAIGFMRSFEISGPAARNDVYIRVADAELAAQVRFRFPNQDDLPRFAASDREILIPLALVAEGDRFVARTTLQMSW